jgi:hypothetical protein
MEEGPDEPADLEILEAVPYATTGDEFRRALEELKRGGLKLDRRPR